MSTVQLPFHYRNDTRKETRQENVWMGSVAIVLGAVLLLSLTAFSAPGRKAPLAGAFDSIAQVKIVARFSVAFVLALMIFRRLRKRSMHRTLLTYLPMVLFVGWCIASTLWSPLRKVTLGQTFSLLCCVLLSIVVCELARCRKTEQWMLMSIMTACALYSLSVVVGLVVAPAYIGLDRFESGIYHPTNIGATASIGMVLTVGIHFLFRYRWALWLVIISSPIHLLALIAAKNRLSLAIATLMVLGLFLWKANRKVLPIVGLVVAAITVAVLIVDPRLNVAKTALSGGTEYVARGQGSRNISEFSGRKEMWDVMVRSYLESPWLGHGYAVSSETGEVLVWYKKENHTAHNAVLQVLVSTGLIGALLFAIFLLQLVLACFYCNLSKRRRTPMAQLTAVALVWFFGWSLLNESIFGPLEPETVCFFVIGGLFLSRHIHRDVDEQSKREARRSQTEEVQQSVRNRLRLIPREEF
ncbi:MAG: O-antigen ligase family protein [Planctomycetota bacterium]